MISSFYERIVGTSSSEPNEPKILCIGVICIDVIQVCKDYPVEDSDQRCVEYRWQRGGNASNTCTVLSQLGSHCEFFGSLSSEQYLTFLQDDMRKFNIDFSHCLMVPGVGCPTSTVILSLNTGSRTIIHYNPQLPELTLQDFETLNLEKYSWIHFQGRNTTEVLSMMQRIESYNNSLMSREKDNTEKRGSIRVPITISVELERPIAELLDLLPYADVAFIAKDFAEFRGCDNMSETLRNISQDAKSGATIICAWGDRGAMARSPDGTVVQSPAFPPHKIIDSLGAGDTFNGAVLYYLNKIKLAHAEQDLNARDEFKEDTCSESRDVKHEIKQNRNIESLECSRTEFINSNILQVAVTFACRIAGAKIGVKGYDGLDKIFKEL